MRTPFRPCCVSRLGKVKATYDSLQAATKAAAQAKKLYGDDMEPYCCQTRPGHYHLRKVRQETV